MFQLHLLVIILWFNVILTEFTVVHYTKDNYTKN